MENKIKTKILRGKQPVVMKQLVFRTLLKHQRFENRCLSCRVDFLKSASCPGSHPFLVKSLIFYGKLEALVVYCSNSFLTVSSWFLTHICHVLSLGFQFLYFFF